MKKIKTVIFLSNFFNHHQKPFSDAMYAKLGDGYKFIETSSMTQERKKMGWEMENLPSYVVHSQLLREHTDVYKEQILRADVVIFGSAPYDLVKRRIRANKLTFCYSERLLKKGMEPWKYPYRLLRWHWKYPQNKNVHLLCASAYTVGDYRKFFLFRNRAYKWGYFPETKNYDDIEGLIQRKSPNSLIWVARYIDWKHPEIAIEICKRLKREGYTFELKMIGTGPLLEETINSVKEEDLENEVHILGAMTPEEVRQHMEQAQIHLFTSDQNEGWGAVLNESMNSACVPVADRNIGAVPYLIKDGENGYRYSGVDELYEKVKCLLDYNDERKTMAKSAYIAIKDMWSAQTASDRLLLLSESILWGVDYPEFLEHGPCERA